MKPSAAQQAKPVMTQPMRRLQPPKARQAPVQVPANSDTDQLIESLRGRINDLEARLAALESVISVQNQDVVINSAQNVLIHAQANVEVSASARYKMSAAIAESNTAMHSCSGVVKCDTLIASYVNSTSYSPGAGNIW